MTKSRFKQKEFIFPSGKIEKVQGYEPFALRDLLSLGLTEEQIKTGRSEIPRIKFTIEEKEHYYFPDIFIPHENRIIEVKSEWTYKCKTDFVIQKGEAAKAAGYNYECWIYNRKGERVEEENEIVNTNHTVEEDDDEEFYRALLLSIESIYS